MISFLAAMPNPSCCGVVTPTLGALFYDGGKAAPPHVSTFFFALNKSAAQIFLNTYDSFMLHRAVMVSETPALNNIRAIHFSTERNPWRWGGMERNQTPETIERKLDSVILEYLLSVNILESNGVLLPLADSKLSRIKVFVERSLRKALSFA
jgi:hypothetical protein